MADTVLMTAESAAPARLWIYPAAWALSTLPVPVVFSIIAYSETRGRAIEVYEMGPASAFFVTATLTLVLTAPGAFLLRWAASLISSPGISMAAIAGAALGPACIGMLTIFGARIDLLLVAILYAPLGAVCGALYWVLELWFKKLAKEASR